MTGAFRPAAIVLWLAPILAAGHVGRGRKGHVDLTSAFSSFVIDVESEQRSSHGGQGHAALVGFASGGPASVEVKAGWSPPKRGWGPWDSTQGDESATEGDMRCGATTYATASSDKYARCPDECPLFARDLDDKEHCAFKCVAEDKCAATNPDTPVADLYYGECRSPTVQWCKEYNFDGTDTCKTCKRFFHVGPDGQCAFDHTWALNILLILILVAVMLLIIWWSDMECRPAKNQTGLQTGLLHRERQKQRMPDDPDQPGSQRYDWPFWTNLMRQQVAGPGLVLFFNFQAMIIIWALLVAACWAGFAIYHPELLILGTRRFGLARANCILVAWGAETQQRLMWTKIYFLVIVYFMTFLGCLWHGARQRRIFRSLDGKYVTMKDFVARVDGLPAFQGAERWEEKLKNAIQMNVGSDITVVGTSLCWDFRHCKEEVLEQVHKDALEYDVPFDPPGAAKIHQATLRMNPVRRGFYKMEQAFFNTVEEKQESGDDPETTGAERLKKLLLEMKCSSHAFVVFRTEQERNMAVAALGEKGGFTFEGSQVALKKILVEPDTVAWWHFGAEVTTWSRAVQYAKGLGFICCGLLAWCVFFYAPYCYSALSFNYDNGQEPSFVYGLSFSMVVVIGNVIMYQICAVVAAGMGFLYTDSKEACYMILYIIACTMQVLLDVVVTWFIAWEISTGMNFRTIDGVRLEEIDDFSEQFESYAMQRRLAENAFDYAFPSTFLIPFVIEPFVTILLPLRLAILLVRSHIEVVGRAAEGWLASPPMDLSRYADLLLNVILAVIIFYFPGGYTLRLFCFLAMSHCFIYCLDHVRVLRVIPSAKFATMEVDLCSQHLLIPICGLILSSLVFKANCQGYGYCLHGTTQVLICTVAFLVHCLVHYLCVLFFVPLFGGALEKDSYDMHTEYKTMAQQEACSWFNTNPVNCLRSKYIYEHEPPCQYWMLGKEHTLEPNPDIGCFFADEEAVVGEQSLKSYRSGLSPDYAKRYSAPAILQGVESLSLTMSSSLGLDKESASAESGELGKPKSARQ